MIKYENLLFGKSNQIAWLKKLYLIDNYIYYK